MTMPLPPKELRCTFPVPCWMLLTIWPGVTALGALAVVAPGAPPAMPGGGDRPRVVLKRSLRCPLTLTPLIGILPAGLIVPWLPRLVPIGDAFLWRPPVDPTAPRPVFIGIVPPTMLRAGEGELPRAAGLAGKTTTLAPVPPPEAPEP